MFELDYSHMLMLWIFWKKSVFLLSEYQHHLGPFWSIDSYAVEILLLSLNYFVTAA